MSTILFILVLAAAGWLAVSLAGAYVRNRSSTGGSVEGFSRALDALDSASGRPVQPRRRQRPRPSRPSSRRSRPARAPAGRLRTHAARPQALGSPGARRTVRPGRRAR